MLVLSGVAHPTVLIAVPLLVFVGMQRIRGTSAWAVVAIAMFITISGPRDGLWFVERAWALSIAGWFVGFTMAAPSWRLSSRAMAAVTGSIAVGVAYMSARGGAWEALDWTASNAVVGTVATTLDAAALFRDGAPISPAFVSTMYTMAEAQAAVFPAMVGLASMAALAVAWWVFTRVTGGGDQAIEPVGTFRFNDHFVWVLIGGLVLLLANRWGEGVTRIGANAVVFMSALYALRGVGVVMFVSGGLSWVGYTLLALALLFVSPMVVGTAVLIGIGDTWLNLRARVREPAN